MAALLLLYFNQQVLPFQVLHGYEGGFPRNIHQVVNPGDVGVGQFQALLHLILQGLVGHGARGTLRIDLLDGHLPFQLQVMGQPDLPLAAFAQHFLPPIAALAEYGRLLALRLWRGLGGFGGRLRFPQLPNQLPQRSPVVQALVPGQIRLQQVARCEILRGLLQGKSPQILIAALDVDLHQVL